MNDLCSRFLEVLHSEVDTYWSFSCYMEKFSKDFCADGLYRKMGGFRMCFQTVIDLLLALILIQLVVMVKCCFSELEAALLKELDPQLHAHLVTDNMEKITFCHRWVSIFFFFFLLFQSLHKSFFLSSIQVASVGFPARVWAQRCSASVWDSQLWSPGAHLTAGGSGSISGETGTQIQPGWETLTLCLTLQIPFIKPKWWKINTNIFQMILMTVISRGWICDGAPGCKHRLHFWTLHVCHHLTGEQRIFTQLQERGSAHTVYQQVCMWCRLVGWYGSL